MSRSVDEILADCLDAIAAGQMTPAECLRAWPEQRDELAALLETAAMLQSAAAAQQEAAVPSPAFRAQTRERLPGRLPAPPAPAVLPAPPTPPATAVGRQGRTLHPNRPIDGARRRPRRAVGWALAFVLLGLFITSGAVYAGSNRALPGQMLYGLKSAVETARLERADSPEQAMTLRLDFAERRLSEIEQLLARRRPESLAETSAAYARLLRETIEIVEQAGEQRAELTAQLEAGLQRQGPRLQAAVDETAALQAELRLERTPSLETAVAALTAGQTYVRTGLRVPEGARLLDVLALDGRFTRWVAAVETAELGGLLGGRGPLTLLAPTDDAIAALPPELWERLTGDAKRLKELVRYHVLPGVQTAADLAARDQQDTNLGLPLALELIDGVLVIDGVARLLPGDVPVTNGMLQMVDRVLVPPQPLYQLLTDNPNLSRFTAAIEQAGLNWQLQDNGPFTLFAPTDAAFAALPAGAWEAIAADPLRLRQTLLYHYAPGEFTSAELGGEVPTALGIGLDTGVLHPITADLRARNGILHIVDVVLIPPAYP